jgi:hypothetical protein
VCLAVGIRGVDAEELPRRSPESQGVDSGQLHSIIKSLDGIETMNSVMVLRYGLVIAEGWWAPYRAKTPHSRYSLSKSFTSTAIGIAEAEGS